MVPYWPAIVGAPTMRIRMAPAMAKSRTIVSRTFVRRSLGVFPNRFRIMCPIIVRI